MGSPDELLIERLRKENLDQFFTLVRMHLSFLVDINTDDVDCSTDKPKQFRWNFHKKIKNSAPSSSQTTSNGGKIGTEASSITEDGILRLNELIDFLSIPENVTQEGIFRRTGSLTRQQELKQLLLTGSSLGLDEGRFSVHDCASVLKGFLAELPQPLLMDQYYQTYCTLAAQYPPNLDASEPKLLTALQLLLLLLAPLHRNFLQRLLTLLTLVADNEASNRMSPDTLATMFTPHLLCPRKLSPEAFHADAIALSPVISFMIRLSCRLFLSPPQLVTDARAYLTAREARLDESVSDKESSCPQKRSPDVNAIVASLVVSFMIRLSCRLFLDIRPNYFTREARLDESVSDKTAANTVFTFVDRGRTAAENSSNPTDTALAQLYAHIQALPESTHKRRLIKHFNRQNGYGTPIQIQRTGKVAGSRSFGDSIKRHIFNKGLLNKTPKKGSGSTISSIEEKKKRHDDKNEVLHKNIVLKNLVHKIASSESLDDDDYNSDASNESTLSEGAISKRRKTSPKFVSEPNLSMLDCEETPKNAKKGTRLFRSKLLSASQNINKKYQKRNTVIKGTPTSCVSCFDEQDTGSENDLSYDSPIKETPKKRPNEEFRIHYLTSTPGVSEAPIVEDCATPYTVNFRRASMSPITKSTQKLSKAMQESIMTPRSRKPLIITCEQRDATQREATQCEARAEPSALELARDNDSDFVSSDDDTRSTFSGERSITSMPRSRTFEGRSLSAGDISPLRSGTTRFILSHQRPVLEDLNITLEPPKISVIQAERTKSLTEPFREYLLSRSVLTATPVDLSMLNTSKDKEEISDSLLYCLDGNVPSDLTSSISNLAVNNESMRSPLKNVNGVVESPSRKRASSLVSHEEIGSKKALVEKENLGEPIYEIRETDL